MTPSAGFHPQTPGTGLDHYSSSVEWHATGIEVVIKESHPEPGLRGQIGIIRNVLANTCAVFLIQEERTVNIQPDQLKPVVPKPTDRVKVIAGDCREQTGILTSVDGEDGVVEMDARHANEDSILLLPLRCLGKFTDNEHHEYKYK
jgi:transcription elongation factor